MRLLQRLRRWRKLEVVAAVEASVAAPQEGSFVRQSQAQNEVISIFNLFEISKDQRKLFLPPRTLLYVDSCAGTLSV